jgi:glycosyltransferase involved in cell wall biosynthesis
MIQGLRQAGVDVLECQEQLWRDIDDRVRVASGGWVNPSFWLRVLRVYLKLLRKYSAIGEYDVLIAGYPGHFDVFLARLLSWRRDKPLIWDVFMSLYLVSLERGLEQRSRLTVNLLRHIERAALRLPDLLIQDTAQYVDWLVDTHGVPPERFGLMPTGAEDEYFQPLRSLVLGKELRVVYFGTFIPNHGVSYIIEAARLSTGNQRIQFELIGDGPERERCQALATEYRLQNITWSGWLQPSMIINHALQADVCLGAFGHTPQSLMTVQNKIYQGMALGLPVVSGDSPALRGSFHDGVHLRLVDRDDPQSLADCLQDLADHPEKREKIAAAGQALFLQEYSIAALGRRFRSHLDQLIDKKNK